MHTIKSTVNNVWLVFYHKSFHVFLSVKIFWKVALIILHLKNDFEHSEIMLYNQFWDERNWDSRNS